MLQNEENLAALTVLNSMKINRARVTGCKHINQKSDRWVLHQHKHPQMEMMYLLSGSASINLQSHSAADHSSQEISVSMYDVVIFLPHMLHQEYVDLNRNQEIICVWVDIDYTPLENMVGFKVYDPSGELRWLFESIQRIFPRRSAISDKLANTYAQAILYHYVDYFSSAGFLLNKTTFIQLQTYINSNLSKQFTPSQLARMCGISSSYLHRLFKKHTGTTPIRYINSMRIKAAQRLLQNTDYPITKISHMVGFEDASYFSRLFRKEAGVSPSFYRGSESVDPQG